MKHSWTTTELCMIAITVVLIIALIWGWDLRG